MGFDQRTVNLLQTTDAEFRTWVAALIASILASGMTQTSDTGQIDTATVTRPGAINTSAGYAMFRLNDSLHATKPVYIKLEFGTGAATTTPSYWVTIGTNTDGAGTITGTTLHIRLQRSSIATASTGIFSSYKASIGFFFFALRNPTSIVSLHLSRTCDKDDNITGEGVVRSFVSNTTPDFETSSYDVAVLSLNTFLMTFPITLTAQAFRINGRPAAFPCIGWCFNKFYTVPGILGIMETNFSPEVLLLASPNGVEHTYMAMTHSFNTIAPDTANNSGGRFAVVWE